MSCWCHAATAPTATLWQLGYIRQVHTINIYSPLHDRFWAMWAICSVVQLNVRQCSDCHGPETRQTRHICSSHVPPRVRTIQLWFPRTQYQGILCFLSWYGPTTGAKHCIGMKKVYNEACEEEILHTTQLVVSRISSPLSARPNESNV